MDFGSILHYLKLLPVFVLMISILVAAHEFGHYLFARLFGMGVEEFAIGFGRKPIWTWMRKTYSVESTSGPAGAGAQEYNYATDGSSALAPEPAPTPSATKLTVTETTDFTIRPWPLGGFVRIKGMMPEEDGSETQIPGGFYSKAPWKRFFVLLAGPVFSVLAGVAILFFVFLVYGKPTMGQTPEFEDVMQNGPAWNAGLRAGDRIVSLDGKNVAKAYDVVVGIRDNAGKHLPITFMHDGNLQTSTLTPVLEATPSTVVGPDMKGTDEKRPQGKLGAIWKTTYERVGFGEAVEMAVEAPVNVITSLVELFKKPADLKDSVGGPGAIVKATSDAVRLGLDRVFILSASLSISVGIFNLFPVPPLDGGQMLVAVAEMLRGGRRLSLRVQSAVAAIGFALVAMLIVSVLWLDTSRLVKGDDRFKEMVSGQKK